MEFSNETYVRLYVRDTTTWKRLNWQARCVLSLLLRKVDRAGILQLAGMTPDAAVALHTELPLEVVSAGLPSLLSPMVPGDSNSSVLELSELGVGFPNFIEAQEANKTDKQRQREFRERRRDKAKSSRKTVTPRDKHDVETSEVSHGSSSGHTDLNSVTLCCADPLLNVADAVAPKSAATAPVIALSRLGTAANRADPGRQSAVRASNLLNMALLVSYPVDGKWRGSLETLGAKPDDEWDVVSALLKAEVSKGYEVGSMHPSHLADYWDSHYKLGRVPGQRADSKPVAKAAREMNYDKPFPGMAASS